MKELRLEKEVLFIYKTFAQEWISCEDQQEYWRLQADTAIEMARILYAEDMIEEVEKDIEQLHIVAGRLGLHEGILEHVKEQLRIDEAEKALA